MLLKEHLGLDSLALPTIRVELCSDWYNLQGCGSLLVPDNFFFPDNFYTYYMQGLLLAKEEIPVTFVCSALLGHTCSEKEND